MVVYGSSFVAARQCASPSAVFSVPTVAWPSSFARCATVVSAIALMPRAMALRAHALGVKRTTAINERREASV